MELLDSIEVERIFGIKRYTAIELPTALKEVIKAFLLHGVMREILLPAGKQSDRLCFKCNKFKKDYEFPDRPGKLPVLVCTKCRHRK